jgi:hypothetical protein
VAGQEHAHQIGDLAGVVAAVGVEGDDEAGRISSNDVPEAGEECGAGDATRARDHLERQAEAFRLAPGDGRSSVGRVVVDEQHVELGAGAAQRRRRLVQLRQYRSDRRRLVVGPHHDRATHADQPRSHRWLVRCHPTVKRVP